jgi:hypothetical protein
MFSSGPVMLPRLFVGHPRARNLGACYMMVTWTLESSVVSGCPAATKGRIVVNGGTSRREEGL